MGGGSGTRVGWGLWEWVGFGVEFECGLAGVEHLVEFESGLAGV